MVVDGRCTRRSEVNVQKKEGKVMIRIIVGRDSFVKSRREASHELVIQLSQLENIPATSTELIYRRAWRIL